MKIKSLALVAAAVMTAGAAQAADLNKPAKVAVDYVKVCDAYGAGFFYIPGSDTCLQISGYARYTGVVGSGKNLSTTGSTFVLGGLSTARTANTFVSKVETELDIDARTNTSFGLLRSYISLENDFNTGLAGPTNTINMNRGYVQWGGLTAGHIESNFTFFQGYNDELSFSELAPDYQTNALSYTFTFGNGVTATIGIEDSAAGGTRVAGGSSFLYQGDKVPDLVANLNVTQAWGAAQISAAAHQVYGTSFGSNANIAGTIPGVNLNRFGYALLAGVWFNIPTLGAGDKIGFEGTYAQGALGYTSAGEIPTAINGGNLATDASVTTTGAKKLGTSWNVYSSFVHNFTPTVFLAVGGGFQGEQGTAIDGTRLNYTLGAIGGTLGWTPVKGMLIDLNVEYEDVSFSGHTKVEEGVRSGDAYLVGLRFKRSF